VVVPDNDAFDRSPPVDNKADLAGGLFGNVHDLPCQVGSNDGRGLEPFFIQTGKAPFYKMIESLGVSVDLYWCTPDYAFVINSWSISIRAQ
jgi:hypothetical protein